MSKIVNMHEAKSTLSRLVQSVKDGSEREVVIAVAGKPSARLTAYEAPLRRPLGIDEGLVTIDKDFDSENENIAALFSGAEE